MASCCPSEAGPPVHAEYTPLGSKTTLADLPLYCTGDPASRHAVLLVYDIFGWGFPQVFQVCDRLAEAGLYVVCPDFFRGKPWAKLDIKPEDNLMGWIKSEGAYQGKLDADVKAVVKQLKEGGATTVGSVGFCWGASVSIYAAIDGLVDACAGVHPSLFGQDAAMAQALDKPIALLPAGGDPPEAPFKDAMGAKAVGPKCVFHRFQDQTHGFCAARGDWSKPEVAAGASHAIGILKKFFADVL